MNNIFILDYKFMIFIIKIFLPNIPHNRFSLVTMIMFVILRTMQIEFPSIREFPPIQQWLQRFYILNLYRRPGMYV